MSDADNSFNRLLEEWYSLKDEFEKMEDPHYVYLSKLHEVYKLQEGCQKAVKHGMYRISKIKDSLKIVKSKKEIKNLKDLEKIEEGVAEWETRLRGMKGELPVQDNGLYLSVILGSNLNVSLMNENDRYRYKQEYEKFKVTVNCALLFLLFLGFIFTSRILDFIINFVLVWFYCTLTIREAILRINGSKIKGWWILHHYVSCALSGITVTWRDGQCYGIVRNQFIIFLFYLSFVQLLQFRYQTGCLRRLHSLGQRHSMDITVEGFSSWMFKGLTFLIPFLVLTYIFQFYNSYKLYYLSKTEFCTNEWQVPVLSFGFFLVACCNMYTLLLVLVNKWKQSDKIKTLIALQAKNYSNLSGKIE
ncbi:unnamed protein product [Thelazia callipaeda]|uniref:Transmembrane protein 120 homolog n=1 Tax=Thelazia callipaeda TaxID=103827 RepID=A0A158RBS7_THECL|nr:unnamed protein product [Thelazia callipaeda]